MLFDVAQECGSELALDDLQQQRSWQELTDNSLRFAALLRERGLSPGDHMAILMGNRVAYVEIILGALIAGVWITPINWHLSAEEVDYVIADSGAKLVITEPAYRELLENLGWPKKLGNSYVLVIDSLFESRLKSTVISDRSLAGPAGGVMVYTSGTSGYPKGVKRNRAGKAGNGQVLSAADMLRSHGPAGNAIGLNGEGSHLITGPMYHAAPLMYALYDLANGASLIIMPRWDSEMALRLIDKRRISHTHWVPTMFKRCLRLGSTVHQRYDLTSLRLVLHGAEPISVEVKLAMMQWWGPILTEYWGGTEGGVCTSVNSAQWRHRLAKSGEGTVGKALPHFEVFAVSETGERLAAGQIGLLYTRHLQLDQVFEYHNAEEKTRQAYLGPGVFSIGDIGYVDEEGYVFLRDRKSNMIISGGVNIYPQEIEQVLMRHPLVADMVVFGVENAEWGEEVRAVIECVKDVPTEFSTASEDERREQLLSYAREHLATYKLPRHIAFAEHLPRSTTGKISLRRVKREYSS